jgi:hypothetical protein
LGLAAEAAQAELTPLLAELVVEVAQVVTGLEQVYL